MSTDPARILIADEDQLVRRFLTDNLASDGYAVASAGSATAAAVLLPQDRFDLVVVDFNGETLALLDRVRHGGLDRVALDLPMFVLTSDSAQHHRIRLFERGADEVQIKPYSYLELRLRVAALLRRCGRSRARRIRVGRLELDPRDHDVWVDGEPLRVPKTEFALLSRLAAAPTRTFTRAELITELWGAHALSINSRALDSHARRLRARLHDAGAGEDLIKGVRGVGYRYRAPIEIA